MPQHLMQLRVNVREIHCVFDVFTTSIFNLRQNATEKTNKNVTIVDDREASSRTVIGSISHSGTKQNT